MCPLSSFSPEQVLIICFLAALILVADHDYNKINSAGNILVAIGGLLLAFAAQGQYIEEKTVPDDKIFLENTCLNLRKQLLLLEEKLGLC